MLYAFDPGERIFEIAAVLKIQSRFLELTAIVASLGPGIGKQASFLSLGVVDAFAEGTNGQFEEVGSREVASADKMPASTLETRCSADLMGPSERSIQVAQGQAESGKFQLFLG